MLHFLKEGNTIHGCTARRVISQLGAADSQLQLEQNGALRWSGEKFVNRDTNSVAQTI